MAAKHVTGKMALPRRPPLAPHAVNLRSIDSKHDRLHAVMDQLQNVSALLRALRAGADPEEGLDQLDVERIAYMAEAMVDDARDVVDGLAIEARRESRNG